MCTQLRTIKNPYFGKSPYQSEFGNLKRVERRFVSSHEYIKVPCGKCAECKRARTNALIQRGIIESLFSHVFFITLTYNKKFYDKRSIEIDGEIYHYADYDDIQLMFKRLRNRNLLEGREFRYLAVNEYGDKKHRPHFHVLLFVSKLKGDTEETPLFIEKILYDNLKEDFVTNVGTRKFPIYEKLFDHSTSRRKGKMYTNYFVQYVKGDRLFTVVNDSYIPKEEDERSLRYLLGYVNKLSDYEKKLECIIDACDDSKKRKEYIRLLRSQVRFSKGFGCGFTNGKRFYLDKISVRCSANAHIYTEIIDSLPDSYEEFCELYPSMAILLNDWIERDFYQHFKSWKRCINSMDADQYMWHCIYLKYFKYEFTQKYKRYKKELEPRISNYYSSCHDNYMYQPQVIRTKSVQDSPVYQYLRGMVEESIDKKLTCISFRMISSNSYMPMCKYYRQRICTLDDTCRLYEALGIKTFDEWVARFETELSNRAALEMTSNEYKYYNDDYMDGHEKDKLLYDYDSTYNKLFSDRKYLR